MNFQGIVGSAIKSASGFPQMFQPSIVLARVLSGLMVPALKQVAGYNQQPRIYTHQSPMTTAGSTTGETDEETIRFTSNADFLWTATSIINGTNGATSFSFDLQLVFGANDRQMVNKGSGVHAEAIMGAERFAWAMPKAYAIRKNSNIIAKITTTATVQVVNCNVYLIGIDYLDGNVLDATRRAVA